MRKTRTEKRRNKGVLLPTVVMAVLAFIFFAIRYSKGEGQHVQGLNSGLKMIAQIDFSGVN